MLDKNHEQPEIPDYSDFAPPEKHDIPTVVGSAVKRYSILGFKDLY